MLPLLISSNKVAWLNQKDDAQLKVAYQSTKTFHKAVKKAKTDHGDINKFNYCSNVNMVPKTFEQVLNK